MDTSSWIEAMRMRGNAVTRERMRFLVRTGQAAWCAAVRLELWAGVGDARERKILTEFEQVIPEFDITSETWDFACELAGRARRAGRTFPASDLLIAACARLNKVEVESADEHFAALMKL